MLNPIGVKLSVFGRVTRISLGKRLTQLSTCRPAGAKRFTQSRYGSVVIGLLA